jgi:hypothetical protein
VARSELLSSWASRNPRSGRGRVGGGVHATAPGQQERTNQQHTPDPQDRTPSWAAPARRQGLAPEHCIYHWRGGRDKALSSVPRLRKYGTGARYSYSASRPLQRPRLSSRPNRTGSSPRARFAALSAFPPGCCPTPATGAYCPTIGTILGCPIRPLNPAASKWR